MIETIAAREITHEDLREKFNLQQINETSFFKEWQEDLPQLSDEEKRILLRVKNNYFNLINRRFLLEEAVKMVVLSPLLDLAGFYQSPFSIKTEESIEILGEDEGIIVKGNIDVLVINGNFWVLVIESKSSKFDVMQGLTQALTYLLNSPNKNEPTFGFITNGREFVFIKFINEKIPKYSRSYALSIERENELEKVLAILKNLGNILIKEV